MWSIAASKHLRLAEFCRSIRITGITPRQRVFAVGLVEHLSARPDWNDNIQADDLFGPTAGNQAQIDFPKYEAVGVKTYICGIRHI